MEPCWIAMQTCMCITVYQRENVESYCDEALTTSKLLIAYDEVIHPMPNVDVNSNRGDYPVLVL